MVVEFDVPIHRRKREIADFVARALLQRNAEGRETVKFDVLVSPKKFQAEKWSYCDCMTEI